MKEPTKQRLNQVLKYLKRDIKDLIKYLDEDFQRWVRLAKSNDHGVSNCISCSQLCQMEKVPGSLPPLHAGHFIGRSNYSVRWIEDNCYPQCYDCNTRLRGNQKAYEKELIYRLGKCRVKELKQIAKNERLPDKEIIIQKIFHYRDLNKILLKGKMF